MSHLNGEQVASTRTQPSARKYVVRCMTTDRSTFSNGPVRATYDAVATRYADVMVNELDNGRSNAGSSTRSFGPREAAAVEHDRRLGCGPGHVTRYLADRGAEVLGIDLSPAMIDVARVRFPGLDFRVGSMLAIDAKDTSWSGAVALYSMIHFVPDERRIASRELARVLRPAPRSSCRSTSRAWIIRWALRYTSRRHSTCRLI